MISDRIEAMRSSDTDNTDATGSQAPPPHSAVCPVDDLLPPAFVRAGDHVVLQFADGRHVFAQAVKTARGRVPPVKIFKKTYATHQLIGLPYGTVLELTARGLCPLPDGEDLLPDFPSIEESKWETEGEQENSGEEDRMSSVNAKRDNRDLLDTNTSQALGYQDLLTLRDQGTEGAEIVSKIIQNSSTFEQKTDFSRAKYVVRKQMKYQPRCRLVRCTGGSVCTTLHLRDPKRILNLRDDTLAQLIGYANVSAGGQVLLLESCGGLLTGALAQRMGGYGRVLTVYTGQQPSWNEMLAKYNLSFPESNSIKWVHASDVFGDGESDDALAASQAERIDRERLVWPCILQEHTRAYMKTMKTEKEKKEFLYRRAARFVRKLTRHTATEATEWLNARLSDSLIIAAKYEPTETLLKMLKFLAPSCPFAIYSEFVEPLTECFREVQQRQLAINLRLSHTWTREYQVLPGRTHPNMSMSQSGGFILTGVKLDPEFGNHELDEKLLKEIRAEIGGRRGKKTKKPLESTSGKDATCPCPPQKRTKVSSD